MVDIDTPLQSQKKLAKKPPKNKSQSKKINIKNVLSSILTAANPNCIINKDASSKKEKNSSPRFSMTTLGNKV
ncbi:hypothetical protein G9A89_007722 [Geosiphon pyriformis]|nr:hypothetical protein G9A89_007722 [Geosiphon pyriformis]